MRKNYTLVQLLLTTTGFKKNINKKDKLGRTPFAAFFWNYQPFDSHDNNAKDILSLLLDNGADSNIVLNCKPLSVLDAGYERESVDRKYNDEKNNPGVAVTPLIIAIVHRDNKMIDFLIKRGASLNTTDSRGVTPMMYAVKTNDQTLIDKLMKHKADLDMNIRDNTSHNIIDHTVALDPSSDETSTFDNIETLKKVMRTNIDKKSVFNTNGRLTLTIAKDVAANECGKFLSDFIQKKFQESYNFPKEINIQTQNLHFNHRKDSKLLLTTKEEELLKNTKEKDEKPQSQEGCTVKDGVIYQDYNILMHKVDVGHGYWGLYNFYRIQIWKENHKNLYVLFTNWGRIDRWSRGQYQNTPYSTPEDAIKEFKKIFKAKSGNEWEDRESFVNKHKKYRIVQAEFVQKKDVPSFKIDLKTSQQSELPFSTQCLLKDITDVKMIKKAYDDSDIDETCIPFERIKEEVVTRAFNILDQILPLVKKKTKLDAQKFKVDDNKHDDVLKQLSDVLDMICRLSSEYYFLVPKDGYEFEKVAPIDSEDSIEEEKKRLSYLVEFETSKSMILGAMLRRTEVHPLDYIFSSLNCKIELLEENCQESQHILRYMYCSHGAEQKRVEAIYRVQCEQERKKFFLATKPKNRKLLWHGTKLSNMMSILHKGMIVDAPYAEVTGRSFGNGVYFADIFDKSFSYSDGMDREGQYMLLCDVALGKCKQVPWNDREGIEKAKESSDKFDSLHVLGDNIPEEKMTLKTKGGFSIPLGKIVRREAEKEEERYYWYKQDYSEYVVYRPENIVLRYIVRIGTGERNYSNDDLLEKHDQPSQNGDTEDALSNGRVSDTNSNNDSEDEIESD